MTPEQLLRKRVIVENKWPGCQFKVGDILEWSVIGLIHAYFSFDKTRYLVKNYVEPYPYLMRPLQWWEHREASDMPEYVIGGNDKVCGVFKVDKWKFDFSTPRVFCNGLTVLFGIGQVTPATLEDYNNYLKQKK